MNERVCVVKKWEVLKSQESLIKMSLIFLEKIMISFHSIKDLFMM